MHMADALLSPAVGGTFWAGTIGTIGYASKRLSERLDDRTIPLMGVLGAFIFASQMINFTIPGTGSSGHLGGGMILAVLLGPHAAFLVMASVLTVQALFFADGGLLALGCNIWNLGIYPCFVAYPLVYKPLAGDGRSARRILVASMAGGIVGLQMGAFSVVLQTAPVGQDRAPVRNVRPDDATGSPRHRDRGRIRHGGRDRVRAGRPPRDPRRLRLLRPARGGDLPPERPDRLPRPRGRRGRGAVVVRVGASRRARAVDREGHREGGTPRTGARHPRGVEERAGENRLPSRVRLQAGGGRAEGKEAGDARLAERRRGHVALGPDRRRPGPRGGVRDRMGDPGVAREGSAA